MQKRSVERIFTILFLFTCVVYSMLVIKICLFKYFSSPAGLFAPERYWGRSVNLIPFGGHQYQYTLKKDVLLNVILYIPFGFLLAMANRKMCLHRGLFVIPLLTSVLMEVLQFILAVGATDITDVISNWTGAIVGIYLYRLFAILFKRFAYLNYVLTGIAAFVACFFLQAFI